MANLTIRGLDTTTMQNLKTLAEEHVHSIEEEARHIIEATLSEPVGVGEAGDRVRGGKKKT